MGWVARKFFSPGAYAVWCAFESPENWTKDSYTLKHTPSGVQFWMGNGSFFFDTINPSGGIGLLERHFLWLKYKRMASYALLYRMSRLTN